MAQEKMEKWRYTLLIVLGAAFLLFELYIGMVRPINAIIGNPFHLCLALIITFLVQPLAKKHKKNWLWIVDAVLMLLCAIVAAYFIRDVDRLTYRVMFVDRMLPVDLFCSFALFAVLLEAVRRTLGLNLLIFILLFVAYAAFGQYLSGPFRYSGMSWQQFGEMLTLSPDGIFGSPLSTSVNTLFYFLLFGAFFASCGGGDVLIDLGMKLSDKTAGGPAKAAVVSSGLMGMISGSAVANVTTTGVLTIPLMKKAGYTPEEAGAVEAVASTGGQIMPPIMGVGAFIMAEMIGISYAKIAVSAIIPALAYYLSVFLVVHFIAKKRNFITKGNELAYVSKPIPPRLYRLLPIVAVVVLIFTGSSLTRAALVGVVLSIIINLVSKQTRMKFMQFVDTVLDGIRQASSIAIPTAACGIMIGIVVRSGAANKLTSIIATIGGSNLLVALLLAMAGCLLLGMALPTVAAYLVSNILFCPTLISLGIPALQANMFIFYFGVIAQITPPVCLASFTAAGIAGADSWKTGWKAFSFALVTFLAPFIFVFQPSVLLIGTVGEIMYVCVVLIVATIMLAAGLTGYLFGPINWIFRVVLVVGALCVAIPESITDVIGFVIAAVVAGITLFMQMRHKRDATPV